MAKQRKFVQTNRLPIFRTLGESFTLYRERFLVLTKVTLVVAIMVGLLQLIQTDAFNGDATIVSSIAWGYAILALLQVLLATKPTKAKLSQIYTQASGRFLQYVIIAIFFILFALPAIGSFFIFLILVPIYGFPGIIFVPLGLVCVLASLYLYGRYVLALPITANEPISSFSAIALAGRMSKKNILRLVATLLIVLIVVIVVLMIITTLLSLSQALAENKLLGTLINIVLATILIPYIMSVLATAYKKLS